LFENYSQNYDKEEFTKGTVGECDFIEKEINFNKKLHILDVGCGTGRHTIELTKRGYNVTGIDLSESQLLRARQKAEQASLSINFRKADARNLPFKNEFDLVIMLCEGGFPLMETDEMNFKILEGVCSALMDNGKLIFTTLNGLFKLFHSVQKFLAGAANDASVSYKNNSFDLMTFRDHNITTITDDSGKSIELDCNERYYVPSEITWLLKMLRFKTIDIYGARLGAFSRNNTLSSEDFEMLVIAGK
jgi:2-polyprenyl-3-methyl-5-hydroxy-6-metoxy-1,4-benzoquinol methylase